MSSSTLGGQDNTTWNQSLATTLYSLISEPLWSGNQSLVYFRSNPDKYWNATFALFNKTYADNLYSTGAHTTIWDATFNSSFDQRDSDTTYSDLSEFNDNILWTTTFNASFDQRDSGGDFTNIAYFNESVNFTENINFTGNITSADYINANFFKGIYDWIINAVGISTKYLSFNGTDLTFNETQLNITIDNRDTDTNVSTICSTNEYLDGDGTCVSADSTGECGADAVCEGGHTHPASQVTTGTFGAGNYVMDSNLTLEGIKLEANTTDHFIYNNASCIIMEGSTSTLYIC